MSPDRSEISADGQDLSYVTVELTDKNGIRNPKADNLVKFTINGEGTIVGVGNANPVSIESNQLPQRRAWKGRCLVIIKSTGKPGTISLSADADGIPSTNLNITAK
jgi:beta-galactosidase